MSNRLETFADLLDMARAEQDRPRLLFVFAAAELPGDASAAQQASFASGEGGALAPVLCVDKAPDEIESFAELEAESRRTNTHWDIVFVAALPGRAGIAPNADEAVQPMRLMVEAIKSGRIAEFLAVDRRGDLVQLSRA
ncbi:MAG TPA: ribonucleotide reductase subunit alpha [Rudaea sp.]|nr:ribonucleotide reductase subunit alpha [Rudaea sp.]